MARGEQYRYLGVDGDGEEAGPLRACPDCGADLTEEDAITVELVFGGMTLSWLESDGTLADPEGVVLAGLHDCTCCTGCGHRLSSCGSPCGEEISVWGWGYYACNEPEIEAAREQARRQYARDGVVVPDDGVVRRDDEQGCWVEARLWVPDGGLSDGTDAANRSDVDSDVLLAEWDRDNAGRPIKADELKALLKADRRLACLLVARAKVEEWMQDGPQEVARCLSVWMDAGWALSDDEFLLELAENAGLVSEAQ